MPWMRGLRRSDSSSTWMRSTAALFAVHWSLQLAFLVPLTAVVGWAPLAWAAQVVTLVVLGALAGAVGHRLTCRRRWPVPFALAAGWWFVEFLRGHLLGPLRFPWAGVALPLAGTPLMVQPAAWGGEVLLAGGIVAVNAMVAGAMRNAGGGTMGRAVEGFEGAAAARSVFAPSAFRVILPLAFVGAWALLGAARRATVRTEPVVRAAAVQPAVPLEIKRTADDATAVAVAALESVLAELEATTGEGVDVVVLPETSVPVFLDSEPDVAERLSGWAERLESPLLVGTWLRTAGLSSGESDESMRFNAVVPWGPAGPLGQGYRKVGLVPGVEWDPFGEGVARGRSATPVTAPGNPGPLICIESAWSGLARRQARAGAGWLVNVTNDAWLAEDPWWRRSTAFRQHPAHLVLRSVETGLGGLRVGNNGWTGSTDPRGEWTPWLAPFGPGVARGEVRSLEGRSKTLFVRGGWLVGPLAVVSLGLALIVPAAGLRRTAPR